MISRGGIYRNTIFLSAPGNTKIVKKILWQKKILFSRIYNFLKLKRIEPLASELYLLMLLLMLEVKFILVNIMYLNIFRSGDS